MHLGAALKLAKDILSHFNSEDEAESFANNLLSNIIGSDVNQLFLYKEKILSKREINKYLISLRRGIRGEPVSKVLNKRGFWEHEFFVDESVLDPRSDSEVIIEAVIEHAKRKDSRITMLDLGIGSGCLLLTLLHEFENAYGIGIDLSEKAITVALRNAESIGVYKRVNFICGTWCEMIKGKFDVIISNPPYIPTGEIAGLSKMVKDYDPYLALDGGEDGLSCYRSIAGSVREKLNNENSAAFIEVGINQAYAVKMIFENNGCHVMKIFKDTNGIDRCLKIQLN